MKKKVSIDPSWDYLTKSERKKFIESFAWMSLKDSLARGGFWGVRESKKLALKAESLKIELFQDIYNKRPWFEGKNIKIEIYQNKVFAFENENKQVGIV